MQDFPSRNSDHYSFLNLSREENCNQEKKVKRQSVSNVQPCIARYKAKISNLITSICVAQIEKERLKVDYCMCDRYTNPGDRIKNWKKKSIAQTVVGAREAFRLMCAINLVAFFLLLFRLLLSVQILSFVRLSLSYNLTTFIHRPTIGCNATIAASLCSACVCWIALNA